MKNSVAGPAVMLIILLSSITGAGAETPQYKQAVSTYLQNNYTKALPMFQALCKSEPKNSNYHYYMALCYQQVDNDSRAAAEYELALSNSNDAAFKEIIQERLDRTKRRLAKANAKAVVPASTASTGAATAAPNPPGSSAEKKHGPVRKVIWFSTNWCSSCKKFNSSWETGKVKYGKRLSFDHQNAEDPSNWKSVQLYRPKAYPTLVFLDGENNVIRNYADAPAADAFVKELKELGAEN